MRAKRRGIANATGTVQVRAVPTGGRRIRHLGRLLLLVTMMSLGAAALTAASAPADPIDRVQVNGQDLNGSGLQASATWGDFMLTVKNKSSSYTDIKEIDGEANETRFPITSASTNRLNGGVVALTCNVAAGAGGSGASGGSFSCPGLAVPPGQSVTIWLWSGGSQNPAQPNNGLTFVNVIYDSIEVNGKPMDPRGKGLQVTAITTKGSCPELGSPSAWCLTLTDSMSQNGGPTTAVAVTPNSPPVGAQGATVVRARAGFGFGVGPGTSGVGCALSPDGGFDCPTPFGVSPQRYGIDFSDSSFASGLGDISVAFQSTICLNTAWARLASPIAKVADNCTPPSHTTITQAKINQNKHTAFFAFKANGTKKFQCELTRNGKLLSYGSCKSPTSYPNLSGGNYVFRVAGINQGGFDGKWVQTKFTLK